MRIGLLTVHDHMNCGSYLQAFALQRALISMGHKVYFVNLDSVEKKLRIFRHYILSRNPRKILFNLMRMKKYITAIKEFGEQIAFNEIEQKCDAIVIGSDELWNVNNPLLPPNIPIFFGNLKGIENIVAYAPSCGSAKYHDLMKYPFVEKGLKNFRCLSARDNNTLTIIEHILASKSTLVLDPTFLYDWSVEPITHDHPYLLMYDYGFTFNSDQIQFIKKYANQNNLKIISANFYLPWCDESVATSPFEFLSLIRNANCVLTSTFHGTVFSIIFKKKFLTVKGSEKVHDLLEQLHLLNCLTETLNTVLFYDVDWIKVDGILSAKRNISLAYLKNSFS